MTRIRRRLSVLLVVQLVLASGLWVLAHQQQAAQKPQPLLSFDSAQVDKIEIRGAGKTLELKKTKDGWVLPDYHNLQAEQAKVTQFLSDLSQLQSRELVANTAASHDRLQVDSENALATVRLLAGDKELALIRAGKSPSFGDQYVRVGESPQVNLIKWNAYAVQANPAAWFNRKSLAAGPVRELQLPKITLTLDNGTWKSKGVALDQSKVKTLVESVQSLEVTDLGPGELKPTSQLLAVTKEDKTLTYGFAQKGEEYYVQRDTENNWFTINKEKAESLLNADLATLKSESKGSPEKPKTP